MQAAANRCIMGAAALSAELMRSRYRYASACVILGEQTLPLAIQLIVQAMVSGAAPSTGLWTIIEGATPCVRTTQKAGNPLFAPLADPEGNKEHAMLDLSENTGIGNYVDPRTPLRLEK